jgi:hypothetical protein
MNTKANTKTLMYRTAAILTIAMMLFAALPAIPASAVSLNITSVATGTWEATAWPLTQRSGTISVTAGNINVVGTGTAFLTELSVGNIIKTTSNIQVGTVASITSNTNLTLTNVPSTTRTNISYMVQGVGPADNVTIANTHNVTIAANPVHQTGTVTVNSGGTLTVSNPGAVFSTLTVNGTVTGTSGNAFGAVTVNNGGLVMAGTNGTYNASSLTINSGGTVNIARAFTVNGPTSITGAISFSSTSVTSRAMVFAGPVTLNSGATWTEPASGNGSNNTYDFQGNLTNNASTFTTSDSTTHTFSGTAKTISGATTTSIARVKINGTYTNNGTLTVGTNLSGTGALTNSAASTLNLGGTVSISTLANAGTLNKTDGGPITTALANFTNTGTLNLNGTGTITGITNNATGTVNLMNSGSITAFNNAGTLNISDLTVPHFGTLTVSAPTNTVNYSGAGNQTVKRITYNNLIFSGSGIKSMSHPTDSTVVDGFLSIAPTGTAQAGVIGDNVSANILFLGGSAQATGTYGAVGSGATNQNNTYFAATTGYLNVTNNTKLPQTIAFTSAAPTNAIVGGPTYIPTATGGTSGNPVIFTIDTSASSVCSISGGAVSFITVGTCVINADQAGNATYLAASQQQSFDVKSNQTISFTSSAPVNAVAGEGTYTPTATATSGLTVTFTIDPIASSVCSISAGVVSLDAVGTCVIDADQAGDNNYHPAPQIQQSFVISAPTFSDVGSQYWAWNFIERLYAAGITGGCSLSPLQYCPEATVTRAQMAVFLERGIHSSSYSPPAVGGSTGFGDVSTSYWAAAWIKQLATEGITGGCGSGSYCPESPVTRAQMAVFLLRSKYGASYSPPAVGVGTGFSDVDVTYWAGAWIKQLVAEGITAGCGASAYCPEAPVTRAQMAVFLVRTFNLP